MQLPQVPKSIRHAALAVAVAAGLCACAGLTTSSTASAPPPSAAAGTTAQGPAGRPAITTFCGTKSIKVALVDGFGGNPWREIVKAEYEDEARQCPTIKQALYFNANDNPETYIAGIQGLVAQGVKVIITYDDFGSETLGALRAAQAKGVAVVPYEAYPGGTVGTDYTGFISVDYQAVAKSWVDWLNRVLHGKGDLLYIGGPAGNPQDSLWLAAVKQDLASTPGLKLLQSSFLATDFTSAGVQQAVAGALSKYSKIDGYMSSYGAALVGAVRAYQNAGKPMVPIATAASDNELGCTWASSSPRFPLLSLDESPELAPIALRKGVAVAEGLSDPEPDAYVLQPFMDTADGMQPPCDRSLPPGADLSSSLSRAALLKLFAQ